VSRWDDEDDNGSNTNQKTVAGDRNNIVQGMEKQERSRKRRMFLDRWDSILDQGKTKKVKRDQETKYSFGNQNPKKNVFQRIQSGIQSMNRGKAKGLFRRKGKGSKK